MTNNEPRRSIKPTGSARGIVMLFVGLVVLVLIGVAIALSVD
jgi:hypothetical protein